MTLLLLVVVVVLPQVMAPRTPPWQLEAAPQHSWQLWQWPAAAAAPPCRGAPLIQHTNTNRTAGPAPAALMAAAVVVEAVGQLQRRPT
jgi:hypothetical protein